MKSLDEVKKCRCWEKKKEITQKTFKVAQNKRYAVQRKRHGGNEGDFFCLFVLQLHEINECKRSIAYSLLLAFHLKRIVFHLDFNSKETEQKIKYRENKKHIRVPAGKTLETVNIMSKKTKENEVSSGLKKLL